ncbi:MAG: DHA2 family efflux MFS transporter permease subunit [Armatimonadetes bacterium]|nr:DHA2 family efflux MFS transporter permease subunit [Armatimonadota bacterium]
MEAHHAEHEDYTGIIRWIVTAAVLLGVILEILDVSIVNVAIPSMMGNLGATVDQVSWVSTGYIIANVIVLPLTGWLSAHFGRRRYLAGSMILFTAASFLCGTSRSLNELVLFRILQGAGGAALLSTAQATLFEIFPPRQIGMVQALFGIGVTAAPTLGPTLGGWVTDNYSWPWIFFINIPIGTFAAALTLLFLKDSKYHQGGPRRVDALGILLLAVGLGSLQTVLEKGRSEDWFESSFIVILSILAAVGLALFAWWEMRTPEPAVNLRVLKNRGFAAGVLFAVVLGFGLYGGIFILPIYLQQLRGYSAMQTGMILLPGGIATGMMMPMMGRLVYKVPPRNLVALGSLGFAGSMLMLRNITMDTGPEHLLIPLLLRGAALGFLFMPLNLATLISLPPKDIAYGTGLFNLARQLGGSAGIAFLSTFLDHRIDFHRASLAEYISLYDPATLERLRTLSAGLIAKGFPLAMARQQSLAILSRIVQGQASILAFEDCFRMIGVAFLLAIPLLLLFKKGIPAAMRGRPHATE